MFQRFALGLHLGLAALHTHLLIGRQALEAAIASTGKDAAPSNGMPDSAMIISEIGRIDAQLAQAMELLADIRRGAASEGGNA